MRQGSGQSAADVLWTHRCKLPAIIPAKAQEPAALARNEEASSCSCYYRNLSGSDRLPSYDAAPMPLQMIQTGMAVASLCLAIIVSADAA